MQTIRGQTFDSNRKLFLYFGHFYKFKQNKQIMIYKYSSGKLFGFEDEKNAVLETAFFDLETSYSFN